MKTLGIVMTAGKPMTADTIECCELCGRSGMELTRHHLIPRARHNKARTRRQFSRDEMTGEIAMLCRPCHSQVHRVFEHHELTRYYHTIERIKSHSEIEKFIKWATKRPPGLKIRVKH